MGRGLVRRHGRATGQAMVEFALVAPIFFLLLFAIIEGGRFIFYYQTLNNAAREGARYAIVHGYNSSCPSGPMPPGETPPGCYDELGDNVVERVKDAAFGVLGSSLEVVPCWEPLDGDVCNGGGNNGRDQTVIVRATYTYSALVPLIPLPPISIAVESSLVVNN